MRDFPLPWKHIIQLLLPKQLLRKMQTKKLFTLGCTQLSLLTSSFQYISNCQLSTQQQPSWSGLKCLHAPYLIQQSHVQQGENIHVMENLSVYCKVCALSNLMHLLVQLFQYFFCLWTSYSPSALIRIHEQHWLGTMVMNKF